MKNTMSRIIGILAALGVVAAIGFTLFKNKKEIDQNNTPLDRSNAAVAVSVASVTFGSLDENALFPATLKAFDEANISAQTSGIVSSLRLELGQQVSKGQTVGKIDTRLQEINLKTAEINLKTVETNKKSAEINLNKLAADYERAKELYENKAGLEVNMINAKNAYDNAKSTLENAKNSYDNAAVQIELIKQQIANANIIAPLGGTISAKNIKQGEFTNPGVVIASITNIGNLKASVFVEQSKVYQLKLGQVGVLTSSFFPNKNFTGKIIFISPKADANHNYQVDLLLTNTEGVSLKAGTDMFASFNIAKKASVLQIPKIALVLDHAEPFVYVLEQGKAVGKTIKTGAILYDKVEVLSGLKAGEKVVTNGQINIKEGSNIAVLN
jgi:membrane fusion protein, multidrug efflux system